MENGLRAAVIGGLAATLVSGLVGGGPAGAAGGLVALQTAAPSCPDDSGNIYVDCGNGTVTDNRTGLVWLQDANCLFEIDWYASRDFVAGLSDKPGTSAAASEDCGLSDGSSPGEWRLPSAEEWEAMVEDAVTLGCVSGLAPSITNDSGSSCWQEGPGNSFTGIQSLYWSSTVSTTNPEAEVWVGDLILGEVDTAHRTYDLFVWPVRDGQ